MPLPRALAEFNKRVPNRAMLLIAGWMPGFAIVHHTGRTTGNLYRTPVNVYRRDDGYLFALVYGMSSWVKNVIASDGCRITTRGSTFELAGPDLYTDTDRNGIPVPARWVLGWIAVDRFVFMSRPGS